MNFSTLISRENKEKMKFATKVLMIFALAVMLPSLLISA